MAFSFWLRLALLFAAYSIVQLFSTLTPMMVLLSFLLFLHGQFQLSQGVLHIVTHQGLPFPSLFSLHLPDQSSLSLLQHSHLAGLTLLRLLVLLNLSWWLGLFWSEYLLVEVQLLGLMGILWFLLVSVPLMVVVLSDALAPVFFCLLFWVRKRYF